MLERLLQKSGVLRSFEDVVIDTSPEHFAVRGGHVNRHGIGKMNTNIVSIANQILQKEVKSFKPHHPENLHQAVGARVPAAMDEMVRSGMDYTNGKDSGK